jgi:hypothetical protein
MRRVAFGTSRPLALARLPSQSGVSGHGKDGQMGGPEPFFEPGEVANPGATTRPVPLLRAKMAARHANLPGFWQSCACLPSFD